MDGPETIFVDRRVVGRMANKPNPDADEVQYFRWDIVRDMVAQSSGPAEFFVQIAVDTNDGRLYALTNYGEIFYLVFSPGEGPISWQQIELPRIKPDPEDES